MLNTPGSREKLRINLLPSLTAFEPMAWNACANPAAFPTGDVPAVELPPYDPFVSYEFLLALEESGSTTMETGWAPAHLAAENEAGELLGVAPVYVKSHSQGEYVFDHAFADAYERAGGNYYPKVQVAVPFTPVTGRRLLVRPGPHAEQARLALTQGLLGLARQIEGSSVHVTFATKEEQDFLTDTGLGFLPRTDIQFHWENDGGYACFEDFLGSLASRKRKALKRERREALAAGLEIEWVTGKDITEAHWDAFWEFYQDTGSRKWGSPYLTRDFFSRIGAAMPERILLIFATRDGKPIAGALNFIGGDTLFGRYWGCIEDHPFLHFEVCYYQAVDFALSRGLKRVEAGAQGGHKLARGYRPALTYSAHAFTHPGLARAVEDYLNRERREILHAREQLDAEAPFRRTAETESGEF